MTRGPLGTLALSSSMGPGQREKPALGWRWGWEGNEEGVGEPEQLVSWKPWKESEAQCRGGLEAVH